VDELFRAWERWCEAGNRREPGTKSTFGRDLRAAYAKLISDKRLRDGEITPAPTLLQERRRSEIARSNNCRSVSIMGSSPAVLVQ
jgi:hypothetical protein